MAIFFLCKLNCSYRTSFLHFLFVFLRFIIFEHKCSCLIFSDTRKIVLISTIFFATQKSIIFTFILNTSIFIHNDLRFDKANISILFLCMVTVWSKTIRRWLTLSTYFSSFKYVSLNHWETWNDMSV